MKEDEVKITIPDRLSKLGDLFRERNAVYGRNYLEFGTALYAMFGGPLTLETPEEFGRFSMFMHVVGKVSRYSQMIKRGGHADSLDDLSVYAQILQEFDDEWKK